MLLLRVFSVRRKPKQLYGDQICFDNIRKQLNCGLDILGAINRPLFPITLNRRSYIVSHDLLAVVTPCIQCIFKLELPAAGYFGVTRESSAV
jgi:hypothetical protein